MRASPRPGPRPVRFACRGRFARGATESSNLTIDVSLPHPGGGPIVARADLTGLEYHSLQPVLGSQGEIAYFSFRGAMSDSSVCVESDQALVTSISGPLQSRRASGGDVAVTLEFRSIEFRATRPVSEGERLVRFWPIPWPSIRGVIPGQTSLRGPSRRLVRPDFLDPRIDVLENGALGAYLSREPRPIWPWPDRRRRTHVFLPALTVHEQTGRSGVSDEQFLQDAVQTGWDLCTAMSLATVQAVRPVWIEKVLAQQRSFHVSAERPWPIPPLDRSFWLVDPDRVLEFLATSCQGLATFRARNIDLRVPIGFLATEGRGIPVEAAFALAFVTLEQLKDLPLLGDTWLEIVPKGFFTNELRPRFKEVIAGATLCEEQSAAMGEKMAELNRRSLRRVLEHLLEDLNLQNQDTSGELPSLIKMRNDLIHSSKVPGGEEMSVGLDRVRFLAGRLLLALLGWRDFSHCPSTDNRSLLAESKREIDPDGCQVERS